MNMRPRDLPSCPTVSPATYDVKCFVVIGHILGSDFEARTVESNLWRERVDSSDLRVFEAVARLGSITAAAEELHTVQSNVTARIRLLEDELDVRLFRR